MFSEITFCRFQTSNMTEHLVSLLGFINLSKKAQHVLTLSPHLKGTCSTFVDFFFFYDLCCIQVSVKRFTLQSNSGVRVQSWTCTQPHVHPGPAPLGFLHIKESPVGYFHTVTKLPTATNSHTNRYAPKWHHIGTFKYQNDQKILF